MNNNLRDFYQEHCFTGIYSSTVPHSFSVGGKISGALFAAGEIKDAIPIIHGPIGCGFHYRYNARRRYLPVYEAECTNLSEKDIIFGGADKLRETVLAVSRRYQPALIVVVPSTATDMIHAEIRGVLAELQPLVASRLIAVESEVFSHIDKNTKKRYFRQWLQHWDKPETLGREMEEYKGCGFGELMSALVRQVMQGQPVASRTVNIEGFAWGAGGNLVIKGMVDTLRAIGIHTNCLLPNCTTADIVTAPRAQLNIVRRVRWAKGMQALFGTEYFPVTWPAGYQGLQGIVRLYRAIARHFDLEEQATAVLERQREHTLAQLQPVREFLGRYRFTVYSRSFGNIPALLDTYGQDYGLPIHYICLAIDQRRMRLAGSLPDTVELGIRNIYNALAKNGSKAQVIINPSAEELREIMAATDYVLGGRELAAAWPDARILADETLFTPFDFENYRKIAYDLAGKVKQAAPARGLMLTKFGYNPLTYPLLDTPAVTSSHILWRKMWLLRGASS
ncbi:MAG TPA: nitrogenase component 1 [Methylomusa anaerophila]|uniref:Nitrogenase molybdenum-iron protein alpha chain n=1 Tax=Methylomusa anaerophila TaxID=1930071 RepID=A0A348AFE8_9FIRM|nr:nitrogenase component 1 [Methylomusa anaerophila]BBB89796.1 nitrogenase molybdenum-iron protein alpha chain [Methylomusa anaerophila]HML89157.1 nitrogenase component 1 [Methylomusa anaerophila]